MSCDIVVVGGSAGALEPFRKLVMELPRDFEAAVFVVMHLSPDFDSSLSAILNRSGPFTSIPVQDGQSIQQGHIYVAPPDHHLTLEPDVIRVQRGPRENRHRPAIDPLFRSAARAYGVQVVGVIMSGFLNDGAAGLLAVRSRGGYAIIQDPKDAAASQMPEAALKYAGADLVLPAAEIGQAVVKRVRSCEEAGIKESSGLRSVRESPFANLRTSTPEGGEGRPSPFSCPECSGVLWELRDGNMVRFRCRVGHAYTIDLLHQEQGRAIETALWAAMRALEEKAALGSRISDSMTDSRIRARLKEQVETDRSHADTIRRLLLDENSGRSSQDASESTNKIAI